MNSSSHVQEELPEQGEAEQKYKYKVVDPVPKSERVRYEVCDPTERQSHKIIYWELNRPIPQLEGMDILDGEDLGQAVLEHLNGHNQDAV